MYVEASTNPISSNTSLQIITNIDTTNNNALMKYVGEDAMVLSDEQEESANIEKIDNIRSPKSASRSFPHNKNKVVKEKPPMTFYLGKMDRNFNKNPA